MVVMCDEETTLVERRGGVVESLPCCPSVDASYTHTKPPEETWAAKHRRGKRVVSILKGHVLLSASSIYL